MKVLWICQPYIVYRQYCARNGPSPLFVIPSTAGRSSSLFPGCANMRRFSSGVPLSLFTFLLLHRWSNNPYSLALNVTWLKPIAGDVYGSGTHLVGQWQSDQSITAPTFQLCNDSDSDDGDDSGQDSLQCGTTVQPAVRYNHDDDSYQVTL